MRYMSCYLITFLIAGMLHCGKMPPQSFSVEVRVDKEFNLDQIALEFTKSGSSDLPVVWEVTPTESGISPTIFAQRRADNAEGTDGGHFSLLLNAQEFGAGEVKRFQLRAVQDTPPTPFRFEDTGETYVHLYENNDPVLTYIYGPVLPDTVDASFRRSSYIHPLFGLDGEVITGDFLSHHKHHRGLFWAWPNVTVADSVYDPWAVRGQSMLIHFEKWLGLETGPVFARFGVQNGWYIEGRKYVDERVWVTVYKSGAIGRIIDLSIQLEAAGEPVFVAGRLKGMRGYGGFTLRTAEPTIDPVVRTNNGVREDKGELFDAVWLDLSDNFQNRPDRSGVTLFQHRENVDFPSEGWARYYGLLEIAWPGTTKYVLEKGKPVLRRHRVWVHRGDITEGKVDEMSRLYLEPPDVRVLD